jgi:hypothetical protein
LGREASEGRRAKPAKGDAPNWLAAKSKQPRLMRLRFGRSVAPLKLLLDGVKVAVGCPIAARLTSMAALAPVASRLVFPQFEAQVRNKSQLRDAAVLGVDAVAVRDVELRVRGNLHRHHIVELGMGTRR